MKYAGKVYSADILVGNVCANTIKELRRQASRKCNRYFKAVDTLVLHRADDKEVNVKLVRINKLSPNNQIIRGSWK